MSELALSEEQLGRLQELAMGARPPSLTALSKRNWRRQVTVNQQVAAKKSPSQTGVDAIAEAVKASKAKAVEILLVNVKKQMEQGFGIPNNELIFHPFEYFKGTRGYGGTGSVVNTCIRNPEFYEILRQYYGNLCNCSVRASADCANSPLSMYLRYREEIKERVRSKGITNLKQTHERALSRISNSLEAFECDELCDFPIYAGLKKLTVAMERHLGISGGRIPSTILLMELFLECLSRAVLEDQYNASQLKGMKTMPNLVWLIARYGKGSRLIPNV
jgi:hypothetical protein